MSFALINGIILRTLALCRYLLRNGTFFSRAVINFKSKYKYIELRCIHYPHLSLLGIVEEQVSGVDMCGTKIFWSRSRSGPAKSVLFWSRTGPGSGKIFLVPVVVPVKMFGMVPVPVKFLVWSRSRSR